MTATRVREGASAPSSLPRLALLLASVFLATCQPVFETRYTLTPPTDATGSRQCLADCAATLQTCRDITGKRYSSCLDRSELQYSNCRQQASVDYQLCATSNTGITCDRQICQRPSCSTAEVDACEANYRSCFAACGGEVRSEEICVAGCKGTP